MKDMIDDVFQSKNNGTLSEFYCPSRPFLGSAPLCPGIPSDTGPSIFDHGGKFLMLSTAATLIIARAKIPRTFSGAIPVFAGGTASSLISAPP